MADEIDENDERALALEIMDGRKCLNTKNQYRLKVEHSRKWLEAKHPECLRLDKIIGQSYPERIFGARLQKKGERRILQGSSRLSCVSACQRI